MSKAKGNQLTWSASLFRLHPSASTPLPAKSVQPGQLHAPVLRPPVRRLVRGDRLVRSEPTGREPVLGHAVAR